jgi:hypothetical protein
MAKHPYNPACVCSRCAKERLRRDAQSRRPDELNSGHRRFYQQPIRRRRVTTRRPTPGSQEWAETRGDDLHDDYGGDR